MTAHILTRAITEGDSYPQHKPWLKRCYYRWLKLQVSKNISSFITISPFSIFNHSDLDPSDPKSKLKRGLVISMLYIKFHYNISFLTQVIYKNHILFLASDLDPSDPKRIPKWGIAISMLCIKFHNNISFLTQVIDRKPFLYF